MLVLKRRSSTFALVKIDHVSALKPFVSGLTAKRLSWRSTVLLPLLMLPRLLLMLPLLMLPLLLLMLLSLLLMLMLLMLLLVLMLNPGILRQTLLGLY